MHSDFPLEVQRRFWNAWNFKHGESGRGALSRRQAALIKSWIAQLGRRKLRIIDVGCGSGWLSEQLAGFGHDVTGIDMARDLIDRAAHREPRVRWIAGDFSRVDLPSESFDVVAMLEVLSHVRDQHGFIAKVARMLKVGGHLMLATQNRFVRERTAWVTPQAYGQYRRWVTVGELRALVRPYFNVVALTSLTPEGQSGVLRVINAPGLNRAIATLVGQSRIDSWKERAMLGHTLLLWAVKRPPRDVRAPVLSFERWLSPRKVRDDPGREATGRPASDK